MASVKPFEAHPLSHLLLIELTYYILLGSLRERNTYPAQGNVKVECNLTK